MAITKIRLEQVQDEIGKFGKAAIPANYNTSEAEDLKGLLNQLQKTFQDRFGADAIANEGIYASSLKGQIAEFSEGQAASATIKNLGGSLALLSSGNTTVDAADITITASGAVSESGASFTGDYTGAVSIDADAASHFKASAGDVTIESEAANLVLSANSAVDMNGASLDADFSGAASIVAGANSEFKVTGQLNMSASGEMWIQGDSLNVDSHGAASIVAGADSEFKVTGSLHNSASLDMTASVGRNYKVAAAADINMTAASGMLQVQSQQNAMIQSFAGTMQIIGSGETRVQSNMGELILSGNLDATLKSHTAKVMLSASSDVELKAQTGDVKIDGKDLIENLTGAWMLDAATFDVDFSGAGHIIAVGAMDLAAASLELSASVDFIRFDDAYKGPASLAGYTDGIKLAAASQDWTDFENAFGEVSLLKAITLAAAGGTPDAADYVLYINDTLAADAALSTATVTGSSVKYTDSAATSPYSPAAIDVATYSEEEAVRNVRIYVNGQRLVPGSDYSINYSSETVDPKIQFALEAGDVVLVEVG